MSSNSNNALKRICKDYKQIIQEPDYTNAFDVKPLTTSDFHEDGEVYEEDDMFHWTGHIKGVDNTPYANGEFKVDIRFTTKYPMEPPIVKFKTKIYHPNISQHGMIYLSILRRKPDGEWSAAWTLGKALIAIRSLFASANPDDPLNPQAANLYLRDKVAFDAQALVMTQEYAKADK
jgi:ubiquitin-protein ligase